MRRLTHLVVLIAFVFSCGGQWYGLQAIAWANMVRVYAEEVPVTQAVQMTLSGKYPCALCHLIAEKKKSETTRLATIEKQQKIFSSPLAFTTRFAAIDPSSFPVYAGQLRTRREPPLLTPPRLA